MSNAEKVQSLNPIMVIIWITNFLIFYWDWSNDGIVSWSIPIIGSVLIVQIYMVWKTNYDEMMEDDRVVQINALGGPTNRPDIVPGTNNLSDFYNSEKNKIDSNNEEKVYLNQPKFKD